MPTFKCLCGMRFEEDDGWTCETCYHKLCFKCVEQHRNSGHAVFTNPEWLEKKWNEHLRNRK